MEWNKLLDAIDAEFGPDVRSAFIENTKNYFLEFGETEFTATSVINAFCWEKTQQGHRYWDSIHKKIDNP